MIISVQISSSVDYDDSCHLHSTAVRLSSYQYDICWFGYTSWGSAQHKPTEPHNTT